MARMREQEQRSCECCAVTQVGEGGVIGDAAEGCEVAEAVDELASNNDIIFLYLIRFALLSVV